MQLTWSTNGGRPAFEHALCAPPSTRVVRAATVEDLDDKFGGGAAALSVRTEDELLGFIVALGDRDEHTPELLVWGERGRRSEVSGSEVHEEHRRMSGEVCERRREPGLGEEGEEGTWGEDVHD